MRRRVRSGVYQIINECNGKSYVGSAANIDNRWSQHRFSFKKDKPPTESLIWRAVRKWGIENFTFIVLEECEPIKEVLLAREQYYIDTLKPEYNICPVAGSRLGSKAFAETIERQRQQMAERMQTPQWEEQLQRMAAGAAAYMNDPENKQKYSALRKGKTFEEIFGEERAKEVLAKQSENRTGKHVGFDPWNKGVPMSEEQYAKLEVAEFWEWTDEKRKNMSEAKLGHEPWNKGVPMPDEIRQKVSEARSGQEAWNKGVPQTEEQRQKNVAAGKARFAADPEHQVRMTEAARAANTGKPRSEETKKNISRRRLASEKVKAHAESRRDIPRPEVGAKVSASLQTSEKAKAYHEGRIGKSRGNNPSGHYGVIWDKSRNKWQVRVKGKSYGRFDNLEDAIAKSQEVMKAEGLG